MSWIDFILSLTGLLLWLNWLSPRFDPLARPGAASLARTLKKADPTGSRRWVLLAALAALLVGRAYLYRLIGPPANWNPRIQLGTIDVIVGLRSDSFGRMLLFSAVSFAQALGFFYLSLLFLSIVNTSLPDTDPLQKLVRLHFGRVEHWPKTIRLLLPLLVTMGAWLAVHPLMQHLAMLPKAKNGAQTIEEGAVLGLGIYLFWKYVIAAVLLLHLLNSYIYLGEHPFWNFIHATSRNLLAPLRAVPLRIGRMDLAPLVEITLVWLAAYFATPGLTSLFRRLPL